MSGPHAAAVCASIAKHDTAPPKPRSPARWTRCQTSRSTSRRCPHDRRAGGGARRSAAQRVVLAAAGGTLGDCHGDRVTGPRGLRAGVRAAMSSRLQAAEVFDGLMLAQLRQAADDAAREPHHARVGGVEAPPQLYYPQPVQRSSASISPRCTAAASAAKAPPGAHSGGSTPRHHPPRSALARLAAPAPRRAHGHVRLVSRSRRPSNGRPTQRRRPIQGRQTRWARASGSNRYRSLAHPTTARR